MLADEIAMLEAEGFTVTFEAPERYRQASSVWDLADMDPMKPSLFWARKDDSFIEIAVIGDFSYTLTGLRDDGTDLGTETHSRRVPLPEVKQAWQAFTSTCMLNGIVHRVVRENEGTFEWFFYTEGFEHGTKVLNPAPFPTAKAVMEQLAIFRRDHVKA